MGRENEKSNITQMFRENKGHSFKDIAAFVSRAVSGAVWINFLFCNQAFSYVGAANRHSKYYQCSDR